MNSNDNNDDIHIHLISSMIHDKQIQMGRSMTLFTRKLLNTVPMKMNDSAVVFKIWSPHLITEF